MKVVTLELLHELLKRELEEARAAEAAIATRVKTDFPEDSIGEMDAETSKAHRAACAEWEDAADRSRKAQAALIDFERHEW